MRARGVNDELAIRAFFYEDLHRVASALSLLFECEPTSILKNLLGEYDILVKDFTPQIDHVGRELFGPISFYLPLLEQAAPHLGLTKLTHLIFPSTQVVKVLQEHDPTVRGVTIGRIYFQSQDFGCVRSIELFQASLQDGTHPQDVSATKERISLLSASKKGSTLMPIDHISIELNKIEEVQSIHSRLHELASETLKPYLKEVSHNPGDGSTQTKAAMRDSPEDPFNRIVEFVHYARPYDGCAS